MKKKEWKQFIQKFFSFEGFIILLLIIIIIVFWFFIFEKIQVVHMHGFYKHKSLIETLIKDKKEHDISVSDINMINDWMTFHYINFIFNLPEEYLKNKFQIHNESYPNITLGKYAKTENIDIPLFLNETKKIILNYTNPALLKP